MLEPERIYLALHLQMYSPNAEDKRRAELV